MIISKLILPIILFLCFIGIIILIVSMWKRHKDQKALWLMLDEMNRNEEMNSGYPYDSDHNY